MDTKGGRIAMNIDGKVVYGRTSAKIMPTNVEVETGVNQDGSGFGMVKPVLPEVDITFDRGLPITYFNNAFMLANHAVTVQELDLVGKPTHNFTGAMFVGRPQLDSATGEVTGLKLHADRYQSF